jgi:hypothetical protein
MSYSPLDIFSLLRDEDCVKMLEMIIEHRHPTVSDFGSRKRYYDRLAKLKRAHLIAKKNPHRAGYMVTPVGAIMHEGLLTLRRAESLRWNFQALDALDKTVPSEERDKMMETVKFHRRERGVPAVARAASVAHGVRVAIAAGVGEAATT